MPGIRERFGSLETPSNWSTAVDKVTDLAARAGCTVLVQSHVISPVHAEFGLNWTALSNAVLLRGSTLAATAVYLTLKQAYDSVMDMDSSLPGTGTPDVEVEYMPDPAPAAAASRE